MSLAEKCTDKSVLQLIVMPTEACNFRCTYCYERFESGRMSEKVFRGLERWIESRAPNLSSLDLKWFGGEPLLERDLVERLMLHARGLATRHPRMRLSSDMTTNGFGLDRETFSRLFELGVTRFQITFDGPKEWHDRKRVKAGGQGTFDRIWHNLLATREIEGKFRIVVRLHADRENHRALPSFIDAYNRAFADDDRYRLLLRKLARFGGPRDDLLPVLNGPDAGTVVEALQQFSKDRAQAEQTSESSVCYAARGTSWLVRSDGRINKCTIALENPANQVGRLREDGTIDVDASKLEPWLRGLWTADASALICPMHGLADGPSSPSV